MEEESNLTCLHKVTGDYIKNHTWFVKEINHTKEAYREYSSHPAFFVSFTLVLLAGVFGNISILVLIPKRKNLRNPMNFLLMNISISHVISCFMLFFFTYVTDTGKIATSTTAQRFVCGAITDGVGFYFVSAGAYLLTLCAISFNRYMAIKFPVKHNLRMTKRSVLACNIVVWIIALAWVVPSMISFHYDKNTGLCLRDWGTIHSFSYRVTALLWSMCLPLLFLLLSYIVIVWKRKENCELNKDARIKRNSYLQKAEKLLGLLIATFVFTWTPFFVYWGLYTVTNIFNGCHGEYKAMRWMRIAVLLSSINIAIDPLLYTVGSKDIRRHFLVLFHWIFRRLPGNRVNRVRINPIVKRNTFESKL